MQGEVMVNELKGMRALLQRWDEEDVGDDRIYPVFRGRRGHVNIDGSPDGPSVTFTPGQPQFEEALEPGVRDLVLTLVALGGVTYSSCEGHPGDGPGTTFSGRHVGLLPRGPEQERQLSELISSVLSGLDHSPTVVVELRKEQLRDAEDILYSLDLCFRPTTDDWARYSRALEPAYEAVLDGLRQQLGLLR
ncbi:hypothetical protein [Enhygromyxa salina]|uniref:hypothetical protein n=1 Tax=Enhygromyxa salina TaxID=215803 RepID=UPI000697E656|nr:hypothetical protein [Enhygromyxa salina]